MTERDSFLKVVVRRVIIFKNFLFSGLKIVIFRPYWHDTYVSLVLFVSVFLNLINWIYLISNRIEGDYPIILHYNLFLGVDFLGEYNLIFIFPFVGFMIFILNSMLGHIFYKGEKLAAYILTVNIFFIQCLLLLASYLIITVNS